MGSEQSSNPPPKAGPRAPPVRRGNTIAVSNVPESCRTEASASGNNSPGASVCSDSELPYISYTVDRPIGDSPKTSTKTQRSDSKKSLLQRRQLSLQARKTKRARDIVVVKAATDTMLDEDIRRLQEIPTFLPIMRGTLGLPGARDPEVLEGLDARPWCRLGARLQAHLAACAHPLAADQLALTGASKQADTEVSRLYSIMVDKQRSNARHAERLSRVHEVAHQLSRCNSLLQQADTEVSRLYSIMVDKQRSNARHAERLSRVHEVAHQLSRCNSLLQQADTEVSRLYSIMVDKQRSNARHAERLSRVHEVAHQLSRCNSLLQQTLSDIDDLNSMLPPDKRLEPFVWSGER